MIPDPSNTGESVYQSIMAPLVAQAAWTSLTAEPMTGVTIVNGEGVVLYCNEQAAVILAGEGAKPNDLIGRSALEWSTKTYVEERKALMRQIAADGKPRLLRTIWRGYQIYSWVQQIQPDEEHDQPSGVFMYITRRVTGDPAAQHVQAPSVEVFESSVVRLGPLDVLSPRELEVLALLADGLTVKEVAARLHRSPKTIENHRNTIGKKLDACDRQSLLDMAKRAGLTLDDAQRRRV